MPASRDPYVRDRACPTDSSGGQCIAGHELVTHLTNQRGQFDNGPRHRPGFDEDEVSVRRGAVPKPKMLSGRNRNPASPPDFARARTRQASAGRLRDAGFAVIHTPGNAGERGSHVSVIWPDTDPLNVRELDWAPEIQAAFAGCFTVMED